ncbi:hypothetical protein RO865_17605 [Blautia faecis]|uniref:hypothetical protein n=1 Tax=Blautia faecis TaxID=871665 RepID=UPI0028A3722A|nr:hypothetical protein [Blautia faecis]MDT4370589.1 hypothetical protein [Blautia faecis]
MKVEYLEQLMTIYDKCIVEKNKLTEKDKENILLAVVDGLLPAEDKYEIYLFKMKCEAHKVFNEFHKWCMSGKPVRTFEEYENFYKNTLNNIFVYQVYEIIYDVFHPIVIKKNFTYLDKHNNNVIFNDEFIMAALKSELYKKMVFKEQVETIDWERKYSPDESKFRFATLVSYNEYGDPFIYNEPEYHLYSDKKDRILF